MIGVRPSFSTGYAHSVGMSQYPELIRGLVGAWEPSLGMTGDRLIDYSGKGNHGVPSGASWTMGKFGLCFEFNGVSDNVSFGNKASINITSNKVSFMAWIYPTAAAGVRGILGPLANETTGYGFTIEPTTIWVYIYDDDGALSQNTGITVSLNEWTHLAVVYNGANVYLYKNGIAVWNAVNIGNILTVAGNIGIGTWRAYEFEGKIDAPSIYNRALIPAEIRLLYELKKRSA